MTMLAGLGMLNRRTIYLGITLVELGGPSALVGLLSGDRFDDLHTGLEAPMLGTGFGRGLVSGVGRLVMGRRNPFGIAGINT